MHSLHQSISSYVVWQQGRVVRAGKPKGLFRALGQLEERVAYFWHIFCSTYKGPADVRFS